MKPLLALLAFACSFSMLADDFPRRWQNHRDIGPVEVKGDASYNAAERSYTVKGSLDTWGTSDGFHMLWTEAAGNIVFNARVVSVEKTAEHAKAGLMIRESLDPGARHVEICVTPGDGTQFLSRAVKNGKTAATPGNLPKGKFPIYLKIERQNQTLSGYESFDGVIWKLVASTNIVLPEKVYVGMVSSSHEKTKLCTSKFDQMGIVWRAR
jgi:regulation of enolase protein 1 (concanavalin A-like superfamily)